MKKQVKLITTIIMIITLMFSIVNIVSASGGAASSALDTMKQGLQGGMTSGGTAVAGLGKSIVGIMQVVGVVVAVVVILVIGIKYLIGSAEERAEYKKTMIPYNICSNNYSKCCIQSCIINSSRVIKYYRKTTITLQTY